MGDTTLRQALDDYKSVYMPYRNFADRTREEYQNDVEDFVDFLSTAGVKDVKDLSLLVVQRFGAYLEAKGFSSLTRKRKIVVIRSFLAFLYQDRYTTKNIASSVVVPFVESPTPHVLTSEEIGRLEAISLDNTRDFAMVELLLHTGIRLSELTNLTTDDIEMQVLSPKGERCIGSIRVRESRGRKERIIPINAPARLALKRYLDRMPTEQGSLFLNRQGQVLGERGVQKILRSYFRKADINQASVHTLRHTFAAKQLALGTSLNDLQEILGHKDRRSTSIYTTYTNQLRDSEGRIPI